VVVVTSVPSELYVFHISFQYLTFLSRPIRQQYLSAVLPITGTAPLTGERAQVSLRGRPRGRLGTVVSNAAAWRGRPRRFGSTQGAGAT